MSNRIDTINTIILRIKEDISEKSFIPIDVYDSFSVACSKINPADRIFSTYDFIVFDNWNHYLHFKSVQIKGQISSLMEFYPYIDNAIIRLLTVIDDRLSRENIFGNIPVMGDLTYADVTIWDLFKYNEKLKDLFDRKYRRYSIEYDNDGEGIKKE